MKVAMVYPEVYDMARFHEKRKEFPPFGVMYLAAMMENHGIEVEIFGVSRERFVFDFRGFNAVGFSISASATFGLIKECRFKSVYSDKVLIMAGGVHPNFYPEQTLLDLQPDVVGVGEGEETILEILQEVIRKDFSKIDGVCFFDNGIPRRTKPRKILRDIDWLPNPARHLLPVEDIVMTNRLSNTDIKMAHVMFTRGCPFPCRFCAAAKTKIQYRSGASARHELIHLKENYGIEGFAIVDDNFVVDKKKVYDVAYSIKDLQLKWSGLSRVDTVDEMLLQAMFDSGCIEVKFGMESGSEKMLKAMQKDTTVDQIRKTVQLAHKIGIKVKLFLVHGYPGENLMTTRESIHVLKGMNHLIDRVSLFRFTPLPGTYVYNHPEEFNLRGTDKNSDWDGNWEKYHIYHNNYRWWGSEEDFDELNIAYNEMEDFITATWPETNKTPGIAVT